MNVYGDTGFTYQMLTDCINDALPRGTFPDSLEVANITPVHKKEEATDKENYRPVSVLPLFPLLPHDLLLPKFGIDKNGLNLIHNYLTNRKQRTKIGSSYSDWYYS